MWLYVPSVFAPESADSTLDLKLAAQILERSVMWRGKPSLSRVWYPRWKKVTWLKLLSGLTLQLSTRQRGVERWIASLQDFPVSRTQLQERERDTMTNERSGPASCDACGSLVHGLSSSKTCPPSPSTSSPWGTSFTEWVSGLRREYSARRKSALPTGGSGSSAWPTASAHDGRRPGHEQGSTQGRNLKREAETWAPPTSRDWKDQGLTDETPTNSLLGRQAPRSMEPNGRRVLNPRFVEWLMGLPLGWTAFEPVAMESYLCRQRMLLEHLPQSCGAEAWPTPTAQDSAGSRAYGYNGQNFMTLTDAALRHDRPRR